MSPKRIVVVGAGVSGLVAIKSLKEEGLEPVCFERTNHYGGLWRYHDDDVEGLGSVMKSTILNTSKEMGSFSDFPPPTEFPNYMHNTHMFRYLTLYAEAFDLLRCIEFNKEVTSVILAENYEITGCLKVTVRDSGTGKYASDIFDGVMVCNGHHAFTNIPHFPGMNRFRGKIMHTQSLKKVEEFCDKRVVVVGAGNSGIDAAVEISSVSDQVYLSSRRGSWILPRLGVRGLPLDLLMLKRWISILFRLLPYNLGCSFTEFMLNLKFHHSLYNLQPKHRIWSQHQPVNDVLPIKLLSGTVEIRRNIKSFTESGVIFDGEEDVTDVDVVVLATGYEVKFPFLKDNILTVKENEVHLYKYVYPPHLCHPTMAIIGLVQPIGAGFPIFEAQCRWTALLMNDKLNLPTVNQMQADIKAKQEANTKRYVHSKRHTIGVDYISYLDEISSLFHAKPNFLKILMTDPQLFLACLFGPSLPYQYRLQGPHSWSGAREAILNYKQRIIAPLKRFSKTETKM